MPVASVFTVIQRRSGKRKCEEVAKKVRPHELVANVIIVKKMTNKILNESVLALFTPDYPTSQIYIYSLGFSGLIVCIYI